MTEKRYVIVGGNEWGNWFVMFEGTLAECESEYARWIGLYEEHDAYIQEA